MRRMSDCTKPLSRSLRCMARGYKNLKEWPNGAVRSFGCRYPKGYKMKSNRPWFSLVLLCFLALPLAAQVNDTYVIPVVGDAPGAAGTRWATELHVFNPQAYTLTVTAVFLPTGGAVGDEVSFNVASNQTAYAENVVADVFERTGVTGSL